METLEQLMEAWNAQADENNKWGPGPYDLGALGLDDVVEFAQRRAAAAERERCQLVCRDMSFEFAARSGERYALRRVATRMGMPQYGDYVYPALTPSA